MSLNAKRFKHADRRQNLINDAISSEANNPLEFIVSDVAAEERYVNAASPLSVGEQGSKGPREVLQDCLQDAFMNDWYPA